ncbi:MAG TPA: MFS transporter [candidate division Zixibacteria bacterium]|nr:MFS transporter [candidate division Zixibacteria bacterium]
MDMKFNIIIRRLVPSKQLLPVLSSYLFDSIAVSIYGTFFAIWLSEELVSSYFVISTIIAFPPILALIGTTFLSSLSDKTGKRKEIMAFSRLFLVLQYLLLIFINKTIWVVLLIVGTTGIFTQVYYVMNNTLTTTLCSSEQKGEMSSYQLIFSSLGWMIGSGTSGLLYNKWSILGCLCFAAISAFIAGIIALFSPNRLKDEEQNKAKEVEETNDCVFETIDSSEEVIPLIHGSTNGISSRMITTCPKSSSFWGILKRQQVIILLITIGIFELSLGPYFTLGTVYLKQIVGLSNNQVSLAFTLSTLVGMITLFVISKIIDNYGRKQFLIFCLTFYAIHFIIFYFLSWSVIGIIIMWAVPLYAFRSPVVNTMMADITSDHERARGMALLQYEQVLTINTGAIIGGLICDKFTYGLKAIPITIVIFSLIALVLAIIAIKETNSKYLKKKMLKQINQ